MKKKDIISARDKIIYLKKLGIEINRSAQHLNKLEDTFILCEQYYDSGNEAKISFIKYLEPVITEINGLELANFDYVFASGSTATIATGMVDASLSELNPDFETYINEFSGINPHKFEIDEIRHHLKILNISILNQFDDLIDSYHKFLNGFIKTSDYAKDLRNFMEHFKGILKNASGQSSKSWHKIMSAICIQNAKMKQLFQKQKSIYETLYEHLSQTLKENITKQRPSLNIIHENFIRMIYTFLTCLDYDRCKITNN